jgi:hypothetical protein
MAVLVLAAGCAPSLTTMQPAHVAPKGHVQATVGFEVSAPTGTITRLIDTAGPLSTAARTRDLMPAEEQQVFEAGVNMVAVPPSVGYHLAANYVLINNLEIGIRYAGGGWRLGGRYQILHRETGPFDLTFGMGVARSAYKIPLVDKIPILEVEDFTRYTIDVAPLQIGTSRSWFRLWAGPKFLYSRFSTTLRASIPFVSAIDLASFEGHTIYYGGQGGVALGYRYLFFAIELTMAKISGTGTVNVAALPLPRDGSTTPIARDADLSGFVIFPTFGLIGEF